MKKLQGISPLLLIAVSAIGAILLLGGFSSAISYTNSMEFCISCHEMKNNVYAEYKETIHYTNRTGVRVECSDCHVPKEFGPKMMRKIMAVSDIYHTLLGTIDTQEKFEASRLEMAEKVWAYMEESDSRECRSCHSFESMDADMQKRRPREKHAEASERGKTCIDCHQGIAHEMPEEDDG